MLCIYILYIYIMYIYIYILCIYIYIYIMYICIYIMYIYIYLCIYIMYIYNVCIYILYIYYVYIYIYYVYIYIMNIYIYIMYIYIMYIYIYYVYIYILYIYIYYVYIYILCIYIYYVYMYRFGIGSAAFILGSTWSIRCEEGIHWKLGPWRWGELLVGRTICAPRWSGWFSTEFKSRFASTRKSHRGLVVVFSFARSQPAGVETKVGCIQVDFCLSPHQKTCCNCYWAPG